jgi:hypothetical protein
VSAPITVTAIDGQVVIRCDSGTARDLAEAWAAAYATCEDLERERPRWTDDVVELHRGAVQADRQAGRLPAPVLVPLLRVVGGELG